MVASSLQTLAFQLTIISFLLVGALSPPAWGQRAANQNRPTIYWPKGLDANTDIKTPRQFFGFEVGHRHLRHDQVVAYMHYLDEVSDRVSLIEYAKTHGGRPLLMLTITAPDNHQRIEEIRRAHRQLTKPNSDQVAIDDLPSVMNMGYGVHGDEPSATNTSPLVAHYLAAGKGPEVERILRDCVILLDPSLNPDGFDRFARWANTFRGRVPNPDPAHIEHNQGWPSGRVNYYWFDLNRDWLPLQHPESRGRMRWYHAWKPNVVLDFHEMGSNSTYFFQPGIPQRTNPLTPQANIDLTREIATYHAKDLDRLGSLYFTQEVFDDFYMGKGSTYPDLHGSIGILFEQGSSRGHIQETQNGIIRFTDTIRNQFTASLSSLRAASEMREKLLVYKRDFYQKSLDSASKHPFQQYAFQAPNNRSRLQAFADILLRHDIKCSWVTEDQIADGRVVSTGSLVVPTNQAEFVFLRSLVERRKKFRESIFYDVSAWTLPLAFDLKQINLKQSVGSAALQPARVGQRPDVNVTTNTDDAPPVAYLIDWRDDAAPITLQRLLAADIVVKVARKPTTTIVAGEPTEFSFGTISIPMGLNPSPQSRRRIGQILRRASRTGVSVSRVDTGLATAGIDLGSNNFPTVTPREVAMVVGRGISAYQAGQAWHQLNARTAIPVTMLNADRLGSSDLSRYTTLILVSGSYDLQDTEHEELERWIRRGGNLIAIGSATVFAERELLNLTDTESADNGDPAADGPSTSEATDESPGKTEKPPRFVDARSVSALALVSGAIFQTEIDSSHPLLYGFDGRFLPVFRNSTRILRDASPPVSNPIRYTNAPLLAGYASEKNQQKIAGSSAAAVHAFGGGRIILLADDPNFRAFWPATSRVFLNAVFFGQFANSSGGRR